MHVIWSRAGCSYCELAKQLMDNQGFKYEVKDVYEHKEAFREDFPDAKTVPQIIFNGRKVGGYDELVRTFEDENIFSGGNSII